MKTRILFIYGPLGGGGAERVLLDILNNINYNCFEIDLAMIVPEGILLPLVPEPVKLIALWPKYTIGYKIALRLSKWLHWNGPLRWHINKQLPKHYDVKISFLEGMPMKLHAICKSADRNISWVHCDIDRYPYETSVFYSGEEEKAYLSMDRIVCVSKDTEQAFLRRFPTCSGKTMVIYNPIDCEKINKLAAEEIVSYDKFTIISVGRLTLPKKMDRILRLAARCKKDNIDVNFKILGDGELYEDLLRQRVEINVENMVEFLGYRTNPFPYIKAADMMFCCSSYEGFCLVICEAMALDVPVVSTRTSGPNEILDKNKYGLLCEQDEESMYQALKKMIEYPEIRNNYISKGKKRIKKFSIDLIIKQVEELSNGTNQL